MYEALRRQRPSLSLDESQSALDVAFALRSTLEAEGPTHEEIVEGSQQVTNALIAQWVAEDMAPANAQEDRDMDESKKRRSTRRMRKFPPRPLMLWTSGMRSCSQPV